jgi:hypothetical protein
VIGKSSEPEDYLSTRHPVVELVEKLVQQRELKHVYVQHRGLSIALRQGAART